MANHDENHREAQRERAAEETRKAEDEREQARHFSHPRPERRAGVRATRHISRGQADADMPSGVPGGYGTTGGGQPGGTGVGIGPGGPLDPAEYADTIAGAGVAPTGGRTEREREEPEDRWDRARNAGESSRRRDAGRGGDQG